MRRDALLAASLLIVTLVAYQPVWHGQPVWDDDAHLTSPKLQSVDGLRRIWFDLGATQQYYPLVHSAFWVMHRAWGDRTTGYHLVNIFLHAFSAWLIARLLRRLAIPGAMVAAFVFALHPVHVESVAWITELKNTLSTALYLGAALAYLRFDASRDRRQWALAAGLFLLALLSKTVTATLPISLLIVLWWKRGAISWRTDVVPLVPFVIAGIAGGILTAWVEHTYIGARGSEFELGLIERSLVAGRAVWFYLASLIWPAHLVFVYPRWSVSHAAWWQYLFPLALGALIVALLRLRHRTRAPLAALLVYGAGLGPALGFINIYPFRYSFVADHFQYLASIAAIAFFAAASTTLVRQRIASLRVRQTLAVGVLAPLAVMTWHVSHQYVDAETLYRTTIRLNPAAWMAHQNLAALLLQRPRPDLDAVMAHARESLRLYANNADAHNNLGYALQLLGRPAEARKEFETAVALTPGLAAARNNLGVLDHVEGRLEAALRQYREVLILDPDNFDANRNLGLVLLDLNRPEEAARHYEDLIRRRLQSATTVGALGSAYDKLGRLEEAIAQYREALRLDPELAAAQDGLGYLLLRRERFAEAEPHLREAIRLRPDYPLAYASLAHALQGLGRFGESIQAYQRALEFPINANSALVRNAFGVSLALSGRVPEAIVQFREALRIDPTLVDAQRNLARASR